jgi:hypothetical protein
LTQRLVGRLIRRRKGTNWLTILSVLALASLPFVTESPPLNPLVRGIGGVVGGLVPGWAMLWVESLLANWKISGPIVALLLGIYFANDALGYRIRDAARKLWVRSG